MHRCADVELPPVPCPRPLLDPNQLEFSTTFQLVGVRSSPPCIESYTIEVLWPQVLSSSSPLPGKEELVRPEKKAYGPILLPPTTRIHPPCRVGGPYYSKAPCRVGGKRKRLGPLSSTHPELEFPCRVGGKYGRGRLVAREAGWD